MNLNEIKDLMAQFDQSSLKEFSYKNGTDELVFSKNEAKLVAETSPAPQPVVPVAAPTVAPQAQTTPAVEAVSKSSASESVAEGDLVESPLVGVAYLAAGPDKPNFVSVGDTVKGFAYTDMKQKLRLTTQEVTATQDQFGWGTVTEVRKDLGVFVDTGLPDKEIVVSLDILPELKELWPKKGDQLYIRLEVDKKKIVVPEPIKTFGTHEVTIKLHKDVAAKFAVKVVEE